MRCHALSPCALLSAVVAVLACVALPGCTRQPSVPADPAKLGVVTTLFPLHDFARAVGKDRVHVTLLLPPGVEPHTFEPTPRDMTRITKADVFIYTGKFMEPWVEDILAGIANPELLVVDASQGIELLHTEDDEAHEHAGGHEHHGDPHAGCDPHIWLDLGNAQKMVAGVARALAQKDPAHRAEYLRQATEYKTALGQLDEEFKQALSRCKHRTIMYGGHFAFGYFARRYGLRHVSPYKGFAPDAEPSPKRIVEMIGKMKALGVKHLFHEELIDPRVAKVVAEETEAELLLLHGAHNVSKSDMAQGVRYIDIMRGNLGRLKIGLGYQ